MIVQDIDGGYFHDYEIHIDYKGQLELERLLFGHNGDRKGITLPMFPLNTDGLDVQGKNMVIERMNITNFDDAVAIKPSNTANKYATCTENIIVRDCNVYFGVGMSIGSVRPSDAYNCVRNIQFLNHKMYHPIKAVYVKNNPGKTTSMDPGSGGEISNITYDGFEVHEPIWFAIYIGPQQQNQPHRDADPGCMLYPLVPCGTHSLVTIKDVTVRNFKIHNALLPPGVIRGDPANPATGINFENVQADGWWKYLRLNYFVENTFGVVENSSPAPAFVTPNGDGFVGDDDEFQWVQRIVGAITGIFSGQTPRGTAAAKVISSFGSVYDFISTV